MAYLENIKEKRLSQAELKKQQDFINSLSSVSTDVRELLASLETSGAKKLDKKVVDAIASLGSIVEAIKQVTIANDDEVKAALKTIAVILKGMDIRPMVTVNEKNVDFDPLIQAIERSSQKVEPEKELTDDDPLAGYKAQDINDDDPHTQYVGFVRADGAWYIIENNDTTNTLRYKFGIKNYSRNFKDCNKLSYKLYSEAINEVSA